MNKNISRIISISRRTDIPAFYMEWFYERLKTGYCEYFNPYNLKKHSISLKLKDVLGLVFWSKDYSKSVNYFKKISDLGYKMFFHYTINNLSREFEPLVPPFENSLAAIEKLCTLFSPRQIVWRYDPILISDITGYDFHLKNFKNIARLLQGVVKKCFISFPASYGKVERSFQNFNKKQQIKIYNPDLLNRQKLANMLADIATCYNIQLYSCCSNYLVNDKIKMASCIDGPLLKELFFPKGPELKKKPSRKECGCYESVDIGTYNSCPHGCIYCYANSNKQKAKDFYKKYLDEKAERIMNPCLRND